MQFLIIGKDGKDKNAKQRRQVAREAHIKMGDELLKAGNLWYGAALLDEKGEMCGSIYMVDFATEEEMKNWMDKEPYIIGEVWKKIEILKCNTRDPWQFNRSKEFFDERQKL